MDKENQNQTQPECFERKNLTEAITHLLVSLKPNLFKPADNFSLSTFCPLIKYEKGKNKLLFIDNYCHHFYSLSHLLISN